MYRFVLPDGQRIPVEAWVYREWVSRRETFFDPELGERLDTAVRIVKWW